MSERPASGVFIAWDEDEVDIERRDADTVRSRTVIVAQRRVVKQVLWTRSITEPNIVAAERYAESIRDQHDNVRVQVFTGEPGSRR